MQNDPEDKAREIYDMGNIYRKATITIAASNSASAHLGFLDAKPQISGITLPFRLPDSTLGEVVVIPCRKADRTAFDWPLYSRGWAYQEYLLSPRLLVFGFGEVWWQCQSQALEPLFSSPFHDRVYMETILPPRLPSELFNSDFNNNGKPTEKHKLRYAKHRDLWWKIVSIYCHRSLSILEDRLPAIAGIAAYLQSVWEDTYLAGLWRNYLVESLAWYSTREREQGGDDLPFESAYIAPSWSWVSVQAPVNLRDQFIVDCEVRECLVEPLDARAALGKVKSGSLTLFAEIIDKPRTVHVFWDHRHESWARLRKGVVYLKLGYPRKRPRMGAQDFAPSRWGPAIGLVLSPDKKGKFRRLGLFSETDEKKQVWNSAERREVAII